MLNDTEKLNKLLDIDEGARYIGEFAPDLNPYIEKLIWDVYLIKKVKKQSENFNKYDIINV